MFIQSIKPTGHIHSSQFNTLYADTGQFQLVALISYMQAHGYGLVLSKRPVFRKAVDKMQPGDRGRRDMPFDAAVSMYNRDESDEHKIFKRVKLNYDRTTGNINCSNVLVRPVTTAVEVVDIIEVEVDKNGGADPNWPSDINN